MTDSAQISGHWISREISVICAVLGLIAAATVLATRFYDIPLLPVSNDGQVSMKANTATAFILCSLALLSAGQRYSRFQVVARWGFAVPVIVIALLTLLQYLANINLGIDQFLVPAIEDALYTTSPGRMSPTTAIGFLALASAIVIDHWHGFSARVLRRAILSLLILLVIGAILGYAYGAPVMYLGIDGVTAMALPTAILFLILAIGAIWLRPDYGLPAILMEHSLLGSNVRALLPMVVAAPLLVGAAVAAGYGVYYEGRIAIALTSLGSVIAASLVAIVSILLLRKSEAAVLVKDRALAATNNGVVITDHLFLNEPIVYVNPAFSKITGYDNDESIGRNCRFLNMDLPDCDDARAELRQGLSSGSSATVELQNRRKDGTLFWNRLSISPIHGRDDRITHYVGILDDVSQYRLQQEQLERALQDTRKANSMRNTFVRLISHELRTPLNAALTWLRLMEVDKSDKTRDKGMDVIADSIDSQSRLIDDLVDVTYYSGAGIRVEKRAVDIRKLTETTAEELRPTIEQDKTLHINIDDGDYTLQADAGRFRQIVRNLLSNAHKYTPANGEISVSLTADPDAIILRVSDTGKGLSQDEIGKIFEPFWRAESHQPGLGVGLSIVNSLVDAHGGSIDVTSQGPDSGSAFVIRLPRDVTGTLNDEPDSQATANTPPSS